MYIRKVISVHDANDDAKSSEGLNPKFLPPTSWGSSAITILPLEDFISVRYNRVSICADMVFINYLILGSGKGTNSVSPGTFGKVCAVQSFFAFSINSLSEETKFQKIKCSSGNGIPPKI